MKVFLVVPRCLSPKQTYREYPLGVGLVATALRQQAHELVLYDQSAEGGDDDALFERLHQFCPEVVCFSVLTPSYPTARRQLERLRRECPGVRIVAGGLHANLFPEDLLADGVDVVVLGQGEYVITSLMERMGDVPSWRGLPGLVFRDRRGNVVCTPRDPAVKPDEEIDIVDRGVFNLPLYTHHSMFASLGCPYHCTFCCNYSAMWRGGVNVRSPQRVVQEMRQLSYHHDARNIFFADDVFFVTRHHILTFCRLLRRQHVQFQWAAQMRVDSIDAEVADALVAAGCRRVYFGVESGSDAVLRRIGKGFDREAIRLGIRCAKRAGLRVKTGWIYGLPGALDEQYETLPFLRELRPHEISIHQLIPFPGTEYYDRPEVHGLRIRDRKDFESFCFGGLGDNVSFDYLPRGRLLELLDHTAKLLESEGYVSSDRATPEDQYVYSTPLSGVPMSVFREP